MPGLSRPAGPPRAGDLGAGLGDPGGLAIGVSLGALGGGGSILTVPALVYLLHRRSAPATRPAPAAAPGSPAGRAAAVTAWRLHDGLRVAGAATVVGLLTGFFGVGGGFVIVPALVLALGFGMATAVGTSLLVIAISSAAALAARAGSGFGLDWALVAVFTGAAIAGTLAGKLIADRVTGRALTVSFACLLVALASYMLARSLPALT